MLVIDVMFFGLELGVGVTVGSLALMADAFHMLNDIISLIVGLWAVKAAQKTSNDKYSFGVSAPADIEKGGEWMEDVEENGNGNG